MINAASLKKIIADQQDELREVSRLVSFVPRDISTKKVTDIFSKGPGLVVIQGVRRCGKSTFAFNCFEGKFVYLNFDDERLLGLTAEDLNGMLSASYELYGPDIECFVLDEIQNIAGWELFVSRLQKTKKLIVTGSNANLLSKELATHLTGRHYSFTLYPFSFREFLRLKKVELSRNLDGLSTKNISIVRALFSAYLKEGGFPDVQKYGRLFSQSIYSDVVNKDILQRYHLRAPATFRKFAHYVISNYAHEINLTKTGKHLGIKDPHTTNKYFGYLEETYLAFGLRRYFHKLKAQLVTNKKSYAIDPGLLGAVAFTPTASLASVYENIVFLELLRRRDYVSSVDEIYFWQGDRCEVDFVIRNQKSFESAIQVCFDPSQPQTLEREVKALLSVKRELKAKKLTIITDSEERILSESGVKISFIPLWKWLLS